MNPNSTAAAAPPDTGAEPLSAAALADAWHAARRDTADAYAAWAYADADDRRTAYAVYLAAADREAAAELGFLTGPARA